MSSSNSSKMEDEIAMVFSDVMDEAMSILEEEEVAAAAASLSTRRSKRRRCYINHDHESAYFRLRHDYFDDDYIYPIILSSDVSYVEDSFPKHYA
jgi:hypothetical protein